MILTAALPEQRGFLSVDANGVIVLAELPPEIPLVESNVFAMFRAFGLSDSWLNPIFDKETESLDETFVWQDGTWRLSARSRFEAHQWVGIDIDVCRIPDSAKSLEQTLLAHMREAVLVIEKGEITQISESAREYFCNPSAPKVDELIFEREQDKTWFLTEIDHVLCGYDAVPANLRLGPMARATHVKMEMMAGTAVLVLLDDFSVHQRIREMEFVSQLGRIGLGQTNLEQLLREVVDGVLARLRVDTAVLTLKERGRLWPVIWRGVLLDSMNFLEIEGNTALSRLIQTAEVVELTTSWTETDGDKQQIAVPLIALGEVIGCLHLHAMPAVMGDSERIDLELLSGNFYREIGTCVGFAIHHARASDEVRQQQVRLETLIAQMPFGVILFNQRGEIVLANDTLRSVLEIPAKSLNTDVRPYTVRTFHGDVLPRADWPFFRATREGISILEEHLILDFGTRQKHVEVSVVPVPGVDSITANFLGTVKDVTARRRQDLFRDEFLSIASHELRNPLTPLMGFLQMLKMQVEKGQRLDPKLVTRSEEQVQRLARLLDDLMDMTRIDAGRIILNREVVDAVVLVRGVIEVWKARPRGNRVRMRYEIPSVLVQLDMSRMEQVLNNLIDNALKYSEGKVDVVVSVENSELCLSVWDSGPGIAPQDIERIFERYYRAEAGLKHSRSMGLGLYITRQLVEQHQGSIEIISTLGHGTKATVRLPLTTH